MSKQEKGPVEINEKETIRNFIATAGMGLCNKDEILDKCHVVKEKIDALNSELEELEEAVQRWETGPDTRDAYRLEEEYGTEEAILARCEALKKDCDEWEDLLAQLEQLISEYKNFNKTLCFSNIRELLRQNPEVKIGQIEKEARLRLGYMSRLEKEGNTSDPSMEFIVSAAKLLKVSIDTLITVDLTGLTPTEQYIVEFFDKLEADTLQDKLDWNIESAFNLNRIDTDIDGFEIYGQRNHPLFTEETFYEETDFEYPQEVTRVVFNSKAFGPHTHIAGDCFNLRLKNGTTLYLMDIEKSVYRKGDPFAFAKEAWIYIPNKRKRQILVTTQSGTPVAQLLEALFYIVKEHMEHPKVNEDVRYAIDSFMRDDIEDDILF